jgi:putative tryptophan/tyrosine transport system substrate-binding protein
MKAIKRLLPILIIGVLLIGCNQKTDQIKIGVLQYANHPILDSVYAGISKEFDESDDKYSLDYQIAHGDPILNATISKKLVKDSVKLIIALGTPSAQAVMNETKKIPIVFTAITDPVGAKLAETMEHPGGNKTGYTNMQPFEKQIELIKIIKPETKKVGIIINSSEANCVAGMVYVRKALDKFEIPYEEVNASTSSEIITAAQSLARKCDVFFISPSNTIYENLGALKKEAEKNGIMIVGGDQSAVDKYGSIGTYTYDFTEMGINTAELAIRILDNDLNPGDIPVSWPANTYLYLNISSAEKLGLKIPDKLMSAANKN